MNPPARTANYRHGFTLIELLTVIAIIGILAAIIIPTVGTVRQTAREAHNLSNLRQLAMALNLHANDNKDLFVWAGNSTPNNSPTPPPHWKRTISQYLSGNNATQFSKDAVFISPTAANPTANTPESCQYSLAPTLTTTEGESATGRIPRSRITRPSQVILVADGAQSDSNGENAAETFYKPNETKYGNAQPLTAFIPAAATQNVDTNRGSLRYRNRGKVHAGMVDGSARAFQIGTVTYGHIVPYQ